MRKEAIITAGLAEPVAMFVRGVKVGDLVVISGTSALSHLSGDFWERELPKEFEAQARQTIANLTTALVSMDLGWSDVFKLFIVLKRTDDYRTLNSVRRDLLQDVILASTAIVAGLPREDMLIEIEAWAVTPER